MTHVNRRIVSPSPGWGSAAPLGLVLVCLASSGSELAQPPPDSPPADRPQAAKVPIPVKIERYAQSLIEKYDADGDGKLDQSEWSRMEGTPRTADLDRDGFITAAELAERIARYGRRRKIRLMPTLSGGKVVLPSLLNPTIDPEAAAAGRPRAAPDGNGPTAAAPSPAGSKAGPGARSNVKFHVPRSRLPAGLPPWFMARDADGDGQLTMAEFAPEGTQSQLEEFARLDRNGDGLLTPEECLPGAKPIGARVAVGEEGEPPGVKRPPGAPSEEAAETTAKEAGPDTGEKAAPTSAPDAGEPRRGRRSRSESVFRPPPGRPRAESP